MKREFLEQVSHVHRQQITTMPASHCYNAEQAVAGDTHRKDGVAEVAVDVANVLRWKLGRHSRSTQGFLHTMRKRKEEEKKKKLRDDLRKKEHDMVWYAYRCKI